MREIEFRAYLWSEKHTNDQWIDYYMGIIDFWKNFINWMAHKELMQYTGLKDKNGKEIYEGDVVKDESGIAVVQFIPPGFVAVTEDGQQWWVGAGKSYPLGHNHLVSTEVIGNIYENPELVK